MIMSNMYSGALGFTIDWISDRLDLGFAAILWRLFPQLAGWRWITLLGRQMFTIANNSPFCYFRNST